MKLPAEICQQAEKVFAEKFGSLERLLEFILTDLVQGEAGQADQQEQRVVEQRLRDLGYL